MIRGAFDIVREHLPFWTLTYQIRFQPDVRQELGERVIAWAEEIRRELEACLRQAGIRGLPHPPALFAAIDGAAQHFALDPERYPLGEVAEGVIRRFQPPPDVR